MIRGFTTEDQIFMRAVELDCQPTWSERLHSWLCICADAAHTVTPGIPVLSWSAISRLEADYR